MSEYTGGTVGPELTPEFWNTVFGWLPWLPTVSEPTAAPISVFILLGIVLVTALSFVAGNRGKKKSEQAGETDEPYYESANQYENEGATGIFEEIEEIQQNIISTSAYEKDTRIPKLGDDENIQMFYVPSELYPKIPIDGYLEPIMEMTDVEYDVLVYFDGQNKERTASRLEAKVTSAAAETATSSMAEVQGKAGRQGRLADLFTEIKDGEKPFKMSTYALVRGETEEDVAEARRKLKETFEDYPVKQPLRTPVGQQREALQSVLPIGRDILGDTDPGKYKSTTVAGAFGAAYASAITPTTVDPNGVEYGWQKSTRLPLILDPWGHDAGNAMVMVADPGGGKSTTGKALMQRVLTQREDVIGVTIEPMGNWAGVAEIFKSEKENPGEYEGSAHITVGGTKGINPLQIREIPPERRAELPDDVDPLGDRKSIAMSFLENFFTMRGNQRRFNKHRTVLENAISDAYSAAKIYHDDLDSHGRPSPTLRDVRNEQLKDRLEHPERYADEAFQEKEIRRAAQWFYSQFEVFDVRVNNDGEEIKGSYANFGKQTEFDIFGNKYVYLDLGQSEGSVSDKAKLTMQILLDQVYEMSKQTDKKVILAMDEFRYFIRDVANIDSIENLFRHHRHQDIAPWIMTQTVHEFLNRSESEAILDMCPYFLGQRYDKMNAKDGRKLGLTEDQYDFVSNKAQPGTPERGYADALLLSGNDGQKLEVHLTGYELAVSEWDRDDPRSMLPGITEDSESAYTLENEAENESERTKQNTRVSSMRRGVTDEEYVKSTVSQTREIDEMDTNDTTTDVEEPTVEQPSLDDAEDGENVSEGEPESGEQRSTVDKVVNKLFDYFEKRGGGESDEPAEGGVSAWSYPEGESVEVRKDSRKEKGSSLNEPSSQEKESVDDSRIEDNESKKSVVGSKLKTAAGSLSKRLNKDSDADTGTDTDVDRGVDEYEEGSVESNVEKPGEENGLKNFFNEEDSETEPTQPVDEADTTDIESESEQEEQDQSLIQEAETGEYVENVVSEGSDIQTPVDGIADVVGDINNDVEESTKQSKQTSETGQDGEPADDVQTPAEEAQPTTVEPQEPETVVGEDTDQDMIDTTTASEAEGSSDHEQTADEIEITESDERVTTDSEVSSQQPPAIDEETDGVRDSEEVEEELTEQVENLDDQKPADVVSVSENAGRGVGDSQRDNVESGPDTTEEDGVLEQEKQEGESTESENNSSVPDHLKPDLDAIEDGDKLVEQEEQEQEDDASGGIPDHLKPDLDAIEDGDRLVEQEEQEESTEDDSTNGVPDHLKPDLDAIEDGDKLVEEEQSQEEQEQKESLVEENSTPEDIGVKESVEENPPTNESITDVDSESPDESFGFAEVSTDQSEQQSNVETNNSDDPFGFGPQEDEEDDEVDEAGGLGVLLDDESEKAIKERKGSDKSDPFAQFADASEDVEGEGNLGFLQDEESVGGDTTDPDGENENEDEDDENMKDEPSASTGASPRNVAQETDGGWEDE